MAKVQHNYKQFHTILLNMKIESADKTTSDFKDIFDKYNKNT